MQKAKEWIQKLVAKPEVGAIYDAKVVRIIDGVGAIVEFLGGKDGMVHISELQWSRTEKVEDVLKVGQEVKVKCIEYDPVEGRTRLSLKQLQPRPESSGGGAMFDDRPPRRPGGSGGRPPHRGPRR